MDKAAHKSFVSPDEIRAFPQGRLELLNLVGRTVGRAVFQPGFRWSTSLKPTARTESCEAPHFQYQLSGTMHIRMDDGTEFVARAGDISLLPPGHDAWVVGNEPVVVIDFQGMLHYGEQPVPSARRATKGS